nr:hypothetical protein [Tanacetum cinerariifolium]
MFTCHDVDMNCLHINVRRLLDFVDVFGYFHDTACLYLLFYACFSFSRRQCVVMIPFLVAPRVSTLAGCDRLVSEPIEKMTVNEVRGEPVMEWKTKVTTKEGIVIKLPGKFHGYKLATKEEVEDNEGLKEVWKQMEYMISDNDSDLESTASS